MSVLDVLLVAATVALGTESQILKVRAYKGAGNPFMRGQERAGQPLGRLRGSTLCFAIDPRLGRALQGLGRATQNEGPLAARPERRLLRRDRALQVLRIGRVLSRIMRIMRVSRTIRLVKSAKSLKVSDLPCNPSALPCK